MATKTLKCPDPGCVRSFAQTRHLVRHLTATHGYSKADANAALPKPKPKPKPKRKAAVAPPRVQVFYCPRCGQPLRPVEQAMELDEQLRNG